MAEVKRLRCFGRFGHEGPHTFQSGRFEGDPVGSCSAVLVRGESGTWAPALAPLRCPDCGSWLTDRTVRDGVPAYCDSCDREVA
jgi:hypothetical protein